LAAGALAIFVATLGGSLTDLGPWYQELRKPAWQPPGPAFGIIWTVVFACAAASGVMAWTRMDRGPAREWLLGLFALNGFLNVLWSLLFFRLQRPDFALWEVGALWLSIVLLIVYVARRSPISAWLLSPYLVWVSIAAVLNYEVVRLNGPFGAGL
jgi:tryptophan-rich sensory protein